MIKNITKNTEDYDSSLNPLLVKSAVETDCNLLNKAIADGGNVNFQTPEGLDLGMISLTSGELYGVSEYIACLIENGIDVNHVDKYYGNSQLLYASRFGCSGAVKLLLENKANINFTNSDGYNSLLNACESIPLFFPFYISIWEQELPHVFIQKTRDMLNRKYVTAKGRKSFQSEQLKTIKTLLEKGIKKDKVTKNGFSAMDLAILNTYMKDNDMVKLLKEYGVKMNAEITGSEEDMLDSLLHGGPYAFYSYCKKDKSIKRKIKEYKRKNQ